MIRVGLGLVKLVLWSVVVCAVAVVLMVVGMNRTSTMIVGTFHPRF